MTDSPGLPEPTEHHPDGPVAHDPATPAGKPGRRPIRRELVWGSLGVLGYTIVMLIGLFDAERDAASHTGITWHEVLNGVLLIAGIAWLALCAVLASHAERRPWVIRMSIAAIAVGAVWGIMLIVAKGLNAPLTALFTLLVSICLLAAWLLARGRPATLWFHAVAGALAITLLEIALFYVWIPTEGNHWIIALNYVIYWVPPVLLGAAICYALDRR
ncbi:MAG: hypothetical protein QM774_13680 [Gordonia sp. (in: high G+C Gram-positive bacteria)]|uniref:hypothetical protein n=1 Tax=Gordonia sp. (in: high G+C Gram-positive bacteria) TaxID=84139 RepID=UPI0039E3271E